MKKAVPRVVYPPVPPGWQQFASSRSYFTEEELKAYAHKTAAPYLEALVDLINDLEMRAAVDEDDPDVVACSDGVYCRAKQLLAGKLSGFG